MTAIQPEYNPNGPSIADIDKELREVSDSTLERYAGRGLELSTHAKVSWDAYPESYRYQLRAQNEIARRRHEAQLQAEKDKQDAKRQAESDQRVGDAVAAFKTRARGAFIGSDVEFDAQWPQILAEWQRRQMWERLDQTRGRVNF